MQCHRMLRLGAVIAPPLAAAGVFAVLACHDHNTPTEALPHHDDAAMTLGRNVPRRVPNARQRLRDRNQYDWVGVAHNQALDDFRAEIRKSGVLTHDLCDFIVNFMDSRVRFPATHAPLLAGSMRPSALAGLKGTGLCAPRKNSARHASYPGGALAPPQDERPSPNAYTLLTQVQDAISAATDSNDLAVRLNAVLDRSLSLSSIDREFLGAVVSVAQHSYEYWKSQLPTFQQEFWNEYSACANQYQRVGMTSDEAMGVCVEGTIITRTSTPGAGSAPPFTIAAALLPGDCSLMSNYKKLAGADVIGAVTGFVKGAFLGPGAVVGAAVGALTASAASFTVSTWDLFWCAMK